MKLLLIVIFSSFLLKLSGQRLKNPEIFVETGGYVSNGQNAPFWFYTNQFGVFSNNNNFLYSRAYIYSKNDTSRVFELNYGFDIYGNYSDKFDYQFNQAYASVRLFNLKLKAGLYRQTFGNQDADISSGSIIYSSNSRPYPRISLGFDNYVPVPYTKGFVEIKGEVTHGWAENQNRWVKDSYIHYKYINGRIGGSYPVHFNFGFHHALQWGGTSEKYGKQPASIKDFLYLFFAKNPPDATAVQGESYNRIGNHIGSRQYGLDITLKNRLFSAYYQTLFEDNSGNIWFSKQGDGLYGLSYINFKDDAIVKRLLFEVTKTTYQSGPASYVWVTNVPVPFWDTRGGDDNYFNNYIYKSWTYYGNTIGTPFITSPIINNNVNKQILNNRVLAFYFSGILSYKKVLIEPKYSYTLNKGTYRTPINDKTQQSFLLKLTHEMTSLYNINMSLLLGVDYGNFLGNNYGIGFSIRKSF